MITDAHPARTAPACADEVAAGVFVFTSRRELTTSTLIATGSSALLVDPAWDPDELAAIAAFVTEHALTITAGFATHAHHDHLLWHRDFGDVPRWASPVTAATAKAGRKLFARELGPDFPPRLAKLVGRVAALPVADLPPSLGPVEVITHDAHLPGHSALWLPSRRVLLAGDMLSDIELPLPFYGGAGNADSADSADRGELVAYLAGLDALAPYVARADVLVPGHGRPTDRPMQRLDADRRYLDGLLAGSASGDARLGNPGMAEVHAQLLAAVSG